MSTSLEPAIRNALTRQAERTTIDPGTTFQPASLRDDDNQESSNRTRRLSLLVAAGSVALLAGLVLATEMRVDEPPTILTQPSAPTAPTTPTTAPIAFPVLDEPPPGLTVTAMVQETPPGTPRTEALVGRVIDDTLTDTVLITVQSEPLNISPRVGAPPTEAVVFDQPATVYDHGNNLRHVTWGSGPFFVASGTSPLVFLDQATAGTFKSGNGTANEKPASSEQPPSLEIGPLPDGFSLIARPAPVGHPTTAATLSIGFDNYDISVSTRNPLIDMALSGPLRRTSINDRPAWTFASSSSTQDIAWQVDDATHAYLKVNDGSDAATAAAIASDIRFVDRDTWNELYAPDPGA